MNSEAQFNLNAESSAPVSWREAFLKAPGPASYPAALWLFSKGLLMGAIDVVPGVSGGTIAFITGIYWPLVNAVSSFNAAALRLMLARQGKRALAAIHLRFLLCLFAGIGTAILLIAGVIQVCMRDYPVPTWAFFFGLVLGSIMIILRQIKCWTWFGAISLLFGAASAWIICGLIPATTPEAYWFYFFCGFAGICAMILPGISGAFVLLVLGKYYPIVTAIHEIKNALGSLARGDFTAAFATLFAPSPSPFWLLLAVVGGQIAGILTIARVLKYLLARAPLLTMSCLTGMMIGALRKIYPWRHQIEVDFIAVKNQTQIIREQLVSPFDYHLSFLQTITTKIDGAADFTRQTLTAGGDPQIGLASGLIVAGFAAVLLVDYWSNLRGAQNERAA